jgi:hypothetical protein
MRQFEELNFGEAVFCVLRFDRVDAQCSMANEAFGEKGVECESRD